MKKLIFPLALLILTSCGDSSVFNTPQKREYTRIETLIHWYEVDSESELYSRCGTPEKAHQTLACAVISANKADCTIYTYKNASLDILGHEFLHCMTGRWHG